MVCPCLLALLKRQLSGRLQTLAAYEQGRIQELPWLLVHPDGLAATDTEQAPHLPFRLAAKARWREASRCSG